MEKWAQGAYEQAGLILLRTLLRPLATTYLILPGLMGGMVQDPIPYTSLGRLPPLTIHLYGAAKRDLARVRAALHLTRPATLRPWRDFRGDGEFRGLFDLRVSEGWTSNPWHRGLHIAWTVPQDWHHIELYLPGAGVRTATQLQPRGRPSRTARRGRTSELIGNQVTRVV